MQVTEVTAQRTAVGDGAQSGERETRAGELPAVIQPTDGEGGNGEV